jgi:sugar transferase (PEP-CTERM/EpsH1 system associated)
MTKMKVLLIISQLPYPPNTGAKIRTFNLIKALSRKHSISLITYGSHKSDLEKVRVLSDMDIKVELVDNRFNSTILAIKNLFSRYPYSVQKYYSKEMVSRIEVILKKDSFDLIHCDSLQVSKNILKIKGVPKALTEHNIESHILGRAAREERNIFRKLYYYLQYIKLREYELSACGQFEHVIAVSEKDKEFLAEFVDEAKISVVPNGVDTEYFKLSPHGFRRTAEDAIVFTGSMDWLPNVDAVKYFYKDILPIIWKVKKNLKFYIVGRNASKEITEIGINDRRITVTGSVEDVRPYMEKAKVFVVPLRIGGGTRLKILEALSMEKVVVSTSIGSEGLDVVDKKNIMIRDDPKEFADAVINLLDHRELRNQLERNGRKLAETEYDYKIVSKLLNLAWMGTIKKESISALLYHDIREDGFDVESVLDSLRPYILKRSDFELQMDWVSRELQIMSNKIRPCIVFDDGWKSNYEIAYPVLRKYGLTATFFITIENIGRPEMITWEELKEMADNGMIIGSHNMTHRPPIEFSDEELNYEMRESKSILEARLGRRVDYFSAPTGFYDERIALFAKNIGYKGAYVSKSALSEIMGDEKFNIFNKIGIKRNCNFEIFKGVARGDAKILGKLRSGQIVRDWSKSVLGVNRYEKMKSVILSFR